MTERIQLLNCRLDNLSAQELLTELKDGLVVTPNVDHLITLQGDREFYDIYHTADYVVLDSQIMLFTLRFLFGAPVKEKVSGSDFFPAFCEYHRTNPDITLFLLGGSEGAGHQVLEEVNASAGREMIVGQLSPPLGFENDPGACKEIVRQINESKATMLAVGVGAPKQEKWIAAHREQLPLVRIFMGIGITIDFMAGRVERAPGWVSAIGMEWCHRLIQEPRRLWRRYMVRDMRFFALVLQQLRGKYRDPFAT